MSWNDHALPHFHALYGEHEVLIDIRTLEVLEGGMPRRALALILEWAQEHRAEHGGWGDMRTQPAAQQDSPLAVTPPIQPRMPWRVTVVNVLPDFRLHVRFVDGTEGVVDMKALVHSSGAGVFAVLADPVLFSQVFVEHGAVTWPGEIDLAPDAMHAEIQKAGTWVFR